MMSWSPDRIWLARILVAITGALSVGNDTLIPGVEGLAADLVTAADGVGLVMLCFSSSGPR
jgi:hypothetical protein